MFLRLLLVFTVIITSHTSCNDKANKRDLEKTAKIVSKGDIKHAKMFKISYHEGYKIITVKDHWSSNNDKYKYLLIEKGSAQPKGYEGYMLIETPIENMICLSSTNLAFADKLNLLDQVLGIDNINYINNKKALELYEKGQIKEIGSEANINVETILNLEPDIVFAYSTSNSKSGIYNKLNEVEIKVGMFSEYLETTPLGRAEWIKFLAAFTNQKKLADSIFNVTEREYIKLRTLATKAESKPTVFTGTTFNSTWYAAGGNSYVGNYFKDAGATYLWSSDTSTGALKLSFEYVYSVALNTDYWVCNVAHWKSLQDVLTDDERFADFKAIKDKQLFNNIASINEVGANDYWESGLVNPHWVLADLINVFHPDILEGHNNYFYTRIQ